MRVPLGWVVAPLAFFFFLAVSAPIFAATQAPVVPNESLVTARVLEREAVDSATLQIQPPQTLIRLKLNILSARDLPSKMNFLKTKTGDVLDVYSKEQVSADVVGTVIQGIISLRGDERGGRYWIFNVKPASI